MSKYKLINYSQQLSDMLERQNQRHVKDQQQKQLENVPYAKIFARKQNKRLWDVVTINDNPTGFKRLKGSHVKPNITILSDELKDMMHVRIQSIQCDLYPVDERGYEQIRKCKSDILFLKKLLQMIHPNEDAKAFYIKWGLNGNVRARFLYYKNQEHKMKRLMYFKVVSKTLNKMQDTNKTSRWSIEDHVHSVPYIDESIKIEPSV